METKLIYGPPGTGKSTALINRMKYLLDSGVPPSQVCFLSFSNAAKDEIEARIGGRTGCTVSTIHSLANRAAGYTRDQIVTSEEQSAFFANLGYPLESYDNDSLSGQMILGARSRSVNNATSVSEELRVNPLPSSARHVELILESYDSWRSARGLVDFDDMLVSYVDRPIDLGFQHLIVDEGQDLSTMQWKVIEAMVNLGNIKSVTIAGDDDQTVNEWNGALAHGMDNFGAKFGMEAQVLNQSWRIPRTVHALAERIIGRVSKRIPKVYMPREELGTINRRSQFSPEDIKGDTLILCRTESIRLEVFAALEAHRIPYTCKAKHRAGAYDSKSGKAVKRRQKLAKLGGLNSQEMGWLISASTELGKKLLTAGKLKEYCDHSVDSVIRIPPEMVEFYRDVDMSLVPQVRVSTIHSAKGWEADNVILFGGMTARVADAMKTTTGADAEHRVWYVGVTRARHSLTIVGDLTNKDYDFD